MIAHSPFCSNQNISATRCNAPGPLLNHSSYIGPAGFGKDPANLWVDPHSLCRFGSGNPLGYTPWELDDVMNEMTRFKQILTLALAVVALLVSGCAKRVSFRSLPLARSGNATVRIELTYDRNNILQVKLSRVPEPSSLNNQFTRYVLWVATPDRQHIINVGQLRVDEKNQADIRTLTPLHRFILFITAETSGDVMSPGSDVLFETKEINW
jgi:hypothetical protein